MLYQPNQYVAAVRQVVGLKCALFCLLVRDLRGDEGDKCVVSQGVPQHSAHFVRPSDLLDFNPPYFFSLVTFLQFLLPFK